MLLRKAVQNTKIFLHKTLQNLKSVLIGGYQKLPKSRSLNPNSQNVQQLDDFYKDFSELWESDNEKMKKNKKTSAFAKVLVEEEGEERNSLINRDEEREMDVKKTGRNSREGKRGEPCPVIANGGCVLAQKMKELEMMDVNDVDHVLDIEEVLHLYSRLKSPVYLDIVNKFFMDMYSEFFLPQPSTSITSSSRRLGPLKF
ncbi:uncharacterized protein LOC131309838 [Rhododendron vialii]|uniref:uncharacterized protein LOC131309838 n=1 Tax=Rhododendron vialii TaxID=182163 RepID=UPI002660581F|nr:uncharacterized protein LOC131309838 [Rhododendron vialii]